MRTGETFFRVTGPNFVAGLIACNGRVVHCAPILRKLGFMHCTGRQFAALCGHHGFTWERLDWRVVADTSRSA